MWTPKGRTKSVHNSEVSTLVKQAVSMDHRLIGLYKENKWAGQKCPQGWGVHKGGVSTGRGSTVVLSHDIHMQFSKWHC